LGVSLALGSGVGDQFGTIGTEQLKPGDVVVQQVQLAQIAPHPGLIGDDDGVLSVGLPFAAVGG